jgi:hypothetical protein
VQGALEKLKQHPEPETGFMRVSMARPLQLVESLC